MKSLGCVVCTTNNAGRGQKIAEGAYPTPDILFENLHNSLLELTPSKDMKNCLSVVDIFSKWIELFLTS